MKPFFARFFQLRSILDNEMFNEKKELFRALIYLSATLNQISKLPFSFNKITSRSITSPLGEFPHRQPTENAQVSYKVHSLRKVKRWTSFELPRNATVSKKKGVK